MRKEPRSHFGISDIETSKDKGVSLFYCIKKLRNAKCEKCLGSILAFWLQGLQRTKGFSSTAFRNPETRNEKRAQEPFRHFSYWDFKGQRGCSLPLHRENLKREMRKEPRSHFDISATEISKDTGSLFMFSVSATLHGRSS
jgi:hypothetical protein